MTFRLVLFLGSVVACVLSVDVDAGANPIRKVVTLLKQMTNKVEAEGEKKKTLFDKFMCYCSNADEMLGGAITAAENKIPQVESAIEQGVALKKQLEADLNAHQVDRSEAKEAVAKATKLRQQQADAFAKESADLKTNIAALDKAIPAIEKGMSGGFLQTKTASILRKLSIDMDMSNVDRDLLTSFLSDGSTSGYAPKSGEIVGILKTLHDEMSSNLADITATETEAIKDFDSLVAAKTKELDSLTRAIEEKTTRVGNLGVQIAEQRNDLEDTKEQLTEDQKFLADLDKNCELKRKEWAAYQKVMNEELLALADTIKILNDDDALELFKKTLPGASSLLQTSSGNRIARERALKILKEQRSPNRFDARLDLLTLALRGQKVGFEKIIKLIDDLVALLHSEQQGDDTKKAWCGDELDKSDDKKKDLLRTESDLETAIEEGEENIETLKSEIKTLNEGIKNLDKNVAEQTEQRKEEHDDFVTELAANRAAVDLLNFAQNRLNKFYNPSLYKAPPKRELSEEEQITVNMGGTLAPTAAPGGIAGAGISALVQSNESPGPAPEADLTYKKKGEESSGVIAMMNLMIKDMEKEIQENELEEKDAQKNYETFVEDSKKKRATDSQALTDKTSALAEGETELQTNKDSLRNAQYSLMETEKMLSELHGECDWLVKYYDMRKEGRTGEIDALNKAKDVLRGADYA